MEKMFDYKRFFRFVRKIFCSNKEMNVKRIRKGEEYAYKLVGNFRKIFSYTLIHDGFVATVPIFMLACVQLLADRQISLILPQKGLLCSGAFFSLPPVILPGAGYAEFGGHVDWGVGVMVYGKNLSEL